MADLRDRWPLTGLDAVRDALLAAYGDPARGYHDLLHLSEVLDHVDLLARSEPVDPLPVQLAAWFHDGVYAGRPDDEGRSADWALVALAGRPDATEVARLVRLTADHRPGPGDVAGAVLCDADLAVLAAPVERYDAYAAGVRAEYAAYPVRDFAAGRARILRALLDGPLFHTPTGRARWETPARANLARELATLDALAAEPG